MSASRTQEQVNKAFDRLLMHTLPSSLVEKAVS
jgi:hypothetical protein